jgi:hypothetical protein
MVLQTHTPLAPPDRGARCSVWSRAHVLANVVREKHIAGGGCRARPHVGRVGRRDRAQKRIELHAVCRIANESGQGEDCRHLRTAGRLL